MESDKFIDSLKNIDLNLEGNVTKPFYSTEIGMLQGLLKKIETLEGTITQLEGRITQLEEVK